VTAGRREDAPDIEHAIAAEPQTRRRRAREWRLARDRATLDPVARDDVRYPAGSGAALSQQIRARLTRAAVISNSVGAAAALVFGFLVPVPVDSDAGLLQIRTLAAFVVYMPVALWVGIAWGRRLGAPLDRWLRADRPATDAEREYVLRQPVRLIGIAATLWGAAALVFGAVSLTASVAAAASTALIVVLGGATCCAVGYLLAERIVRPIVARALAGGPPPRTVAPGIAARLTMTWLLVTGVPLVGIAAIAITDLAGVRLEESTATAATLFLAATGLVVGLLANVIAARSVADPVRAVREAMRRVEEGDFDARVPVDDTSEIGLLEAGFNRMASGLAERERLRDLFGRHVGRDVAIAALDGELRLGGEVREVAVLFVDVVGSTSLAARRPPTEVVGLLNAFFRIVVETVESHRGWVNKFEGDAALCVFGAPVPAEDPAGDALAAARELRARLAAEAPELDAGIGVSAGPAVAGNVGAEQRFEYTVIGDPVNEAARLCELAKRRPERVLASEAALERVGGPESEHWSLGEGITLRGREEPTRLASPLAR
jgi:adenylate cyclase